MFCEIGFRFLCETVGIVTVMVGPVADVIADVIADVVADVIADVVAVVAAAVVNIIFIVHGFHGRYFSIVHFDISFVIRDKDLLFMIVDFRRLFLQIGSISHFGFRWLVALFIDVASHFLIAIIGICIFFSMETIDRAFRFCLFVHGYWSRW